MKTMSKIERYLRGELSGLELRLFEKRLKRDDKLQKKVEEDRSLFFMIEEAEQEMKEKKIDLWAEKSVQEWVSSEQNFEDEKKFIYEYLN